MIGSDDKKFINDIVTGALDELKEMFFEIQAQKNIRLDDLVETLENISQTLIDIQINQSQDDIDRCQHEHDGMIYTSNPPQNKCIKCGEFYR
tara:strand:+ start:233 stop:508 length:276 start_codon:yes stop_codon:yes gene_type:complete